MLKSQYGIARISCVRELAYREDVRGGPDYLRNSVCQVGRPGTVVPLQSITGVGQASLPDRTGHIKIKMVRQECPPDLIGSNRAGRSNLPVFEVKPNLWSCVSLSDLHCSAIAGVEDWSLRCRGKVYNKIKMVRQNARLT